jgi:hypothetical protein
LHYQNPPLLKPNSYGCYKEKSDVVERKDSPTFGKHFSVLLSAENKTVARSTRICPWFSVLAKTLWCYTNVIINNRAKAASDLMILLWKLTGIDLKTP